MKKALLIVNPSSGGEKAKEYEEMAENKLRTLFDEVTVLHTEKVGMRRSLRKKLPPIKSIVSLRWAGMVR